MAGPVDIARLGYAVDTSGLDRARAAQDAVTASGVRLGQTADMVGAALSTVGRGGAQQLTGAANELNAAARALQQARAALPKDWEQMSQKQRTRWTFENQGAFENIVKARAEFDAVNAAQNSLQKSTVNTTAAMSTMSIAAGTLAGVVGFTLLNAVAGFAVQLAQIPLDAARAQDSLLMLNTQLKFSFQGSAEAARQARADIVAMAREMGVPYAAVANQYAEIAVSGSSALLTRDEVSNLTGAMTRIGRGAGVDNARISRGLWQLQQAIAVGHLTGQDYRLLSSNIPSIDNVLGAGLNVDPNRIYGMVSRGEIDTQRMVEGITRGAERLFGEALPETMETGGARIATEWELMLQQMGDALQASGLVQTFQGAIADQLRILGESVSNDPAVRARAYREQADNIEGMSVPFREQQAQWYRDRAAEFEAEAARNAELAVGPRGGPASPEALQAMAEAALVQRRATNRGVQVVENLDPLLGQRAELNRMRGTLEAAISGGANSPEQLRDLQRGLQIIEGQLARIRTVWQQITFEQSRAVDYLDRYGADGGYDIAERAFGYQERALGQSQILSDAQARQLALREAEVRARLEVGRALGDLRTEREYLGSAYGDPYAEREARIEYGAYNFARQRFGAANDNSPEFQRAVEAQRELLQLQADNEAERRERERAGADEARLRAMRNEMALTVDLGRERRIALAVLQREDDLRRQGLLSATERLTEAERERVAIGVQVTEQLELQRQQLALLEDAARTAGATIGNVLGASISEGIETGRVTGEAALQALSSSLNRILNDMLGAMLAPYEKALTDWIASRMPTFGVERAGGDAALGALGEAAKEAGESLGESLAPSVADSAIKIAAATSATSLEAASKAKAALVADVLTGAMLNAARAAEIFAASAASSSGGSGDLWSTLASIFTGSISGGHEAAHGNFALGGVVSRPQMFAFSRGVGLMGEAGAEAILPLKRGADGKLGVASDGGGASVSVQIIDQRSSAGAAQVEVEETRGPDGERMIQAFIRDEVKSAVGSGAVDREMGERFGASRRIKRV